MRSREADRERKRYRSEQILVMPTESLTNLCANRQRMAARRALEGIGTFEDLAGFIHEISELWSKYAVNRVQISVYCSRANVLNCPMTSHILQYIGLTLRIHRRIAQRSNLTSVSAFNFKAEPQACVYVGSLQLSADYLRVNLHLVTRGQTQPERRKGRLTYMCFAAVGSGRKCKAKENCS